MEKKNQRPYKNKDWTKKNNRVSAPAPEPEENPELEEDEPIRELPSNRAKYEKEIYEEKNEQMLAADFSQLLVNPQSIGGHFQFSHEKSWTTESSGVDKANQLFSNYFNLNLSLLTESIATIPFYNRIVIDKARFTEKEVEKMDEDAKINRDKYEKFMTTQKTEEEIISQTMMSCLRNAPDEIKQPKKHVDVRPAEKETVKSPEKPKAIQANTVGNQMRKQEAKQATDEIDDELNDLLQIKAAPSISTPLTSEKNNNNIKETVIEVTKSQREVKAAPPTKSIVSENKEDIQKWLDDVLND